MEFFFYVLRSSRTNTAFPDPRISFSCTVQLSFCVQFSASTKSSLVVVGYLSSKEESAVLCCSPPQLFRHGYLTFPFWLFSLLFRSSAPSSLSAFESDQLQSPDYWIRGGFAPLARFSSVDVHQTRSEFTKLRKKALQFTNVVSFAMHNEKDIYVTL